ncbi:MAG: alkaline phosphatase family protein, partial [Myxococcota bacterium]
HRLLLPFAILFALAALERLLAWRALGRPRDLVISGLLIGLSVAFKQNYGAFAALGALVSVLAFRVERGDARGAVVRGCLGDTLRLGVGGAAVVAAVFGYFAYRGAFAAVFDSLVIHPFVFGGRQDIAFPTVLSIFAGQPLAGVDALTYGAYSYSQAPDPFFSNNFLLSGLHRARFLERLHLLLFWLPVSGLVAGGFYALRPAEARRPLDGGLAAVLAMAAFVFLGVFPRADFNHLMNVLQPTIIAGVLVAHRLFERLGSPWSLTARAGLAVGCAVVGVYAFTAGSWYLHILQALNTKVDVPRGGVLTTVIDASLIDFHLKAIRERTDDGDALLTVPALTMYNFLADRRVPGRYYNLYEHHIAHDGGAGVVEAAEAERVKLVLADYNNFFSDRVGLRFYAPKLAKYLRTHFENEFDVAGDRYFYMTRREVADGERHGADLVGICDVETEPSAYTREHLLFASLYQARNIEKPDTPVTTPCTFTVPERGELAVSIGYRRPAAVERGARLKAEVWLVAGEERTRLLSKVIPVQRIERWDTAPAPEFRVDLTPYAGKEVTLEFQTSFRGQARMPPFDLGGYALAWHDPRVETRRDRVLLIGIDGATLRVIAPMLADGRLPNLAKIAEEGVSGPLRSAHPLLSPRIWTTIATGKVPRKHGITHWVRKNDSGDMELQLSSDRVVPALWNMTSASGYTNGVVNWLVSYPPEKIRGVMISDFAIAGQREAREKLFAGISDSTGAVDLDVTCPAEWMEDLERLTASDETLLGRENPFESNDALPKWMNKVIPAQSFRDDDLTTRVALDVEERIHPDVLMVYLSGIDKVSHNLWGGLEPEDAYPSHIRFTASERAETVAELEGYYAYTDELIGKLLERYGPDDLVMIVSDHGFEARVLVYWLTGGHDSDDAVDGIVFARGWKVPAGEAVHGMRITDVTPTILSWLGLPVGKDMDGRVASFLGSAPPRFIASWDAAPVERVGDHRAEVESSVMEQLRDLGYVE